MTADRPHAGPPPQEWYPLDGLPIDQIPDVASVDFLTTDQLAGGVTVPMQVPVSSRPLVAPLIGIGIFMLVALAGALIWNWIMIALGLFYAVLFALGLSYRSAERVRLDPAGIWVFRGRMVAFLPWCMVDPDAPLTCPGKATRVPLHADAKDTLPLSLVSLNTQATIFPVYVLKKQLQINGRYKRPAILIALYARLRDAWRSGEPADWPLATALEFPPPEHAVAGAFLPHRLSLRDLRYQLGTVSGLYTWLGLRLRRRSFELTHIHPAQRLDPVLLPDDLVALLRPLLPDAYGPATIYRASIIPHRQLISLRQTHPHLPVGRSMTWSIRAASQGVRFQCSASLVSRLPDGLLIISRHTPVAYPLDGVEFRQIDMHDPAAALSSHLAWLDELGGGTAPTDDDFIALQQRVFAAEQDLGYVTLT